VPYFICPNCRQRSIDHDRLENLTNEAVGCAHCGFGFLFELLDDYYPAPGTGFVVCDRGRRILALGQGVFELTGFRETDVLGRDVIEAFTLDSDGDANPADVALRRLLPGLRRGWRPARRAGSPSGGGKLFLSGRQASFDPRLQVLDGSQ
jgi:hypothetical protein